MVLTGASTKMMLCNDQLLQLINLMILGLLAVNPSYAISRSNPSATVVQARLGRCEQVTCDDPPDVALSIDRAFTVTAEHFEIGTGLKDDHVSSDGTYLKLKSSGFSEGRLGGRKRADQHEKL